MAFVDRLRHWWRGHPATTTEAAAAPAGRARGVVDHVIVLDGTFSTLDPGQESNIGLIFRLLAWPVAIVTKPRFTPTALAASVAKPAFPV